MKSNFINFLKKPISIISIILLILVITTVILVWFKKLETGFGGSETVSIETQKVSNIKITRVFSAKKTLWDLLQLGFVPLVLIFIGIIFNDIQKKREEERAASQKKREEDIAAEIEYENAFQIYLKNLSDLLLNHNLLNSSEGDIVRSLAFTRTKTTVRVLDGERRGRVIRFLYDTSLINTDKQIIRTDDLDLYGANMIGFHFKNANLSNTFLDNSDFRGAVMGNVDFTNSTLKKAILRDAKFETAVLKGINLEGASYDGRTKWPTDFNPKEYKAINSDEIRRS